MILTNVYNDKALGVLIDNNLTCSICMRSIAKKISSNLWLQSKLKEYLRIEYNFKRLIFNLPSIIAPQFGEELLISTATEFADYKKGLLKSF